MATDVADVEQQTKEGFVRGLGLPAAEEEAVLAGNARALFRLE